MKHDRMLNSLQEFLSLCRLRLLSRKMTTMQLSRNEPTVGSAGITFIVLLSLVQMHRLNSIFYLSGLSLCFGAERKLYKWITPMMQGFIEVTESIRVNGTTFKMIFISRRSCRRPGTRFTMRGIDAEGNVANFVETEQICIFQDGRRTSFLQIRGSLPFHWSSPVNMKYVPPVYQRNKIEKDVEAFRKHAYELMQLYGRVILINLIDKRRHELQLGNTLTKVIGAAANQDSHILANIRLVWFDFHQECRKMRYQNLVRLIQLVDDDFRNYGYVKST